MKTQIEVHLTLSDIKHWNWYSMVEKVIKIKGKYICEYNGKLTEITK